MPMTDAPTRPSLLAQVIRRLSSREVLTFLTVGGAGFVVDVAAFNVLRSVGPVSSMDPSVARTLAVVVAMCVTYVGNRSVTWRDRSSDSHGRELGLFVMFNVIGLGFSVLALVVSHDLLGLTSRLADNISANGIGLALGTAFRYVTYKRFVFAGEATHAETPPAPRHSLLRTTPLRARRATASWEAPAA